MVPEHSQDILTCFPSILQKLNKEKTKSHSFYKSHKIIVFLVSDLTGPDSNFKKKVGKIFKVKNYLIIFKGF